MKLRTGQYKYKTPLIGRVECVYLPGNQKHNQMCSIMLRHVAAGALPCRLERGIPTLFAVIRNSIEFYPVPDKPYVVTVRYTPPLQEF
jgi:hypothetical protein